MAAGRATKPKPPTRAAAAQTSQKNKRAARPTGRMHATAPANCRQRGPEQTAWRAWVVRRQTQHQNFWIAASASGHSRRREHQNAEVPRVPGGGGQQEGAKAGAGTRGFTPNARSMGRTGAGAGFDGRVGGGGMSVGGRKEKRGRRRLSQRACCFGGFKYKGKIWDIGRASHKHGQLGREMGLRQPERERPAGAIGGTKGRRRDTQESKVRHTWPPLPGAAASQRSISRARLETFDAEIANTRPVAAEAPSASASDCAVKPAARWSAHVTRRGDPKSQYEMALCLFQKRDFEIAPATPRCCCHRIRPPPPALPIALCCPSRCPSTPAGPVAKNPSL
jgi:hypothetical protein